VAGRLNTPSMVAYSAHYRGGKRVATGIEPSEAADLARGGDGFVWIAMRDPSADELKAVASAFDLSVPGIGGPRESQARPSLEGYKGRAVLTIRTATYDERRRIEFGAVKVLVGSGYVITVGRGAATDPAGARERLEDLHPELIAAGPGAVIWAILDALLDGYEPVTSAIDDGIEKLEQQVFAGDRKATEATYSLTRQAIEFDRATTMLLNPLDSVVEGEVVELDEKLERFLRDAANHLRRINGHVAAQREILGGILDANLALISVHQNEVVQKISAWAAIIAIPTFFASIWGMNFTHMPELDQTWGYPFALALMLVAVIALYGFFKRVAWL